MLGALLATLHIMAQNGAVYDIVEHVPDGACIMGRAEELVYEATSINVCDTITLPAGCYRVELMGGMGGARSDCLVEMGQRITTPVAGVFQLDKATTVYAFRGGDGVGGNVNRFGNLTGAFGGASSGADSIIVADNKIFRAAGGVGQSCVRLSKYSGIFRDGSYAHGVGGGSDVANVAWCMAVCQRAYNYQSDTYSYLYYAGGGGGAPSGVGGGKFATNSGCPDDAVVQIGGVGNSTSGGDGGSVQNAIYSPTETTKRNASGGRGGLNVSWQCGGQTITSYGGGGGGGCVYNYEIDGGDGGSGSVGTSSTSYVRIYRM